MVLSDFLCDYGDRAEPSSQCFEEGFYGRERLEKEIFPRMLFDGRFYSFGVNPNCWSKLVRRELIEKIFCPSMSASEWARTQRSYIRACLIRKAQSV